MPIPLIVIAALRIAAPVLIRGGAALIRGGAATARAGGRMAMNPVAQGSAGFVAGVSTEGTANSLPGAGAAAAGEAIGHLEKTKSWRWLGPAGQALKWGGLGHAAGAATRDLLKEAGLIDDGCVLQAEDELRAGLRALGIPFEATQGLIAIRKTTDLVAMVEKQGGIGISINVQGGEGALDLWGSGFGEDLPEFLTRYARGTTIVTFKRQGRLERVPIAPQGIRA